MKQVSLEFCENFVYGKQKRVRFLSVGKQKKSEKSLIRGNLGFKMGLLRKIIKKATSHYKYAMSD